MRCLTSTLPSYLEGLLKRSFHPDLPKVYHYVSISWMATLSFIPLLFLLDVRCFLYCRFILKRFYVELI